MPDASRALLKELPCLHFTIRQGILHEKLFQKPEKIFEKEVETWYFLQQQ